MLNIDYHTEDLLPYFYTRGTLQSVMLLGDVVRFVYLLTYCFKVFFSSDVKVAPIRGMEIIDLGQQGHLLM